MIDQVEKAEKLLQKKKMQKTAGIKPEQNSGKKLIDAILKVRPDAYEHVLVSIRDVRNFLKWSKEEFDKVVLDLARQGKLTLHHHDHPEGLKPEDRDSLVKDAYNNYYVGMVLEPL